MDDEELYIEFIKSAYKPDIYSLWKSKEGLYYMVRENPRRCWPLGIELETGRAQPMGNSAEAQILWMKYFGNR